MKVIAIDGPAGSGKSTVARALAERLSWSYLDTGAMYRVVALFALRRGIPLDHEEQISQLAAGIDLHLGQTVVADDEDVTMAIRSPEVNTAVSVIAALPKVRRVLVEQQRRLAAESESGSIVEGRDITTVVFPEAIVKIFLTAELGERARRRGDESVESVERRDEIDSKRLVSPLMISTDAHVIDSTGRSVESIVKEIEECLRLKLS